MSSHTFLHITDVGASSGNGVDSTLRILKQYDRLGIDVHVISAGHSPLHVAFAACTDLASSTQESAFRLAKIHALSPRKPLPIALNSAPRNHTDSHQNGKEDYIYRLSIHGEHAAVFVIYGREVLQWVIEFYGESDIRIDRILSVSDLIPDTSSGSQFRSAEHLPIVHFLESENLLDQYATMENVEIDSMVGIFPEHLTHAVILPPDEYDNGRLIMDRTLQATVLRSSYISIPEISESLVAVRHSLTEGSPGEFTIWPSSNHFPNPDLVVMNIGTRWVPESTRITDNATISISKWLSENVGKKCVIKE